MCMVGKFFLAGLSRISHISNTSHISQISLIIHIIHISHMVFSRCGVTSISDGIFLTENDKFIDYPLSHIGTLNLVGTLGKYPTYSFLRKSFSILWSEPITLPSLPGDSITSVCRPFLEKWYLVSISKAISVVGYVFIDVRYQVTSGCVTCTPGLRF